MKTINYLCLRFINHITNYIMLKRMRSFLLLAVLLIATAIRAQVTTSSMSGKITAQNEPIVGATVVAIHEPSGTRYATVTNISGQYNLQAMRTGGPYKVEITYIGYQSAIYKGITLVLGENYGLSVALKESSELLDEVVVTASKESNMKSDRAGAIMSANRDVISSTPTISRSISDIMRLSPQGADVGNGFAVGGGNFRQSFVTVDGAAFNNTFGLGGNLPANGAPISLDALEQITVAVSPFDVRQSGFTGGAINAVTRSGDNQYRGTAYMYFNNENLKGNKVDDYKLERSKAQYYTYGASIGGPIIKNKLFFFVNGEYEDNVTAGSSFQPRTSLSENYAGNVHRPVADTMVKDGETWVGLNNMRDYLKETYGYDPGRFNNYSVNTPAYRIMARLDWNVNPNNKVSLRFSKTHTKDSNFPSTSTSPLTANIIYPGSGPSAPAGSNRTSVYSMTFENSNYYQVRDFTSLAGEWNSRIKNGAMNNMLRFAYSYQNEPREYDGMAFPTVDILKDGVPYANFGLDVFTAGNLRRTSVYTVTDEFNWNLGIHKLMAGLQYEHTQATNGYMQAGGGFYVFDSWNSFVTGKKPSAFGITHSNAADLSQFEAKMKFQQTSLYLQDEVALSENLKVTGGIRFELPIYPSLKNNYNEEFAKLEFGGAKYSTDQLPGAKLSVSPRVGFNWDITGERKYVLRGGTGLFVGRLPFVWLVSAVGNSGVGQTSYSYDKVEANVKMQPNFHTNVNDILQDLYGGNFTPNKVVSPQSPTIIDTDLKMPSTWKTSLALDMKLPGDVDFTLEGIYSRDFNPVVVSNRGYKPSEENITLSPGDERKKYAMYSDATWANKYQNVYLLENWKKGAYYYSITTQLRKKFNFGLDLSFAYTHSKARSYGDGIGDQVTSAYKTNTYSVHGNNEHELGYGTYVAPDRILATIGYRKEYGKHFATSLSLLYEGMQMGYAGSYSYSRYSYTFSSNVVGDNGSNNLLYIPASREDLEAWKFADVLDKNNNITYSSKDQKDDFWNYINQDSYLKDRKGKYAERGGAKMPWHHQLDLKLNQDFFLNVGGKRNTLQFGVDIKNLPNLLNNSWGLYKQVNNASLLSYKNGAFTMNKNGQEVLKDTYTNYQSFRSTYSVQFSVRYIFN